MKRINMSARYLFVALAALLINAGDSLASGAQSGAEVETRRAAILEAIALVEPQLAAAEKRLQKLVGFASRDMSQKKRRPFGDPSIEGQARERKIVIARLRREVAQRDVLRNELATLKKQSESGAVFPQGVLAEKLASPIKGKALSKPGISFVGRLKTYSSSVRFRVEKNEKVFAPAAGVIVYKGVLNGKDVLLMEHKISEVRFWSLFAGVGSDLPVGHSVGKMTEIGHASGRLVEWQPRMQGWPGGIPVNLEESLQTPLRLRRK